MLFKPFPFSQVGYTHIVLQQVSNLIQVYSSYRPGLARFYSIFSIVLVRTHFVQLQSIINPGQSIFGQALKQFWLSFDPVVALFSSLAQVQF